MSDSKKRFFHICYCWGAAVLILGVLFNLMKFPYGDVLMIVGMAAECFIFFLSAFDSSETVTRPLSSPQLLEELKSASSAIDNLTRQLQELNEALLRLKAQYEHEN